MSGQPGGIAFHAELQVTAPAAQPSAAAVAGAIAAGLTTLAILLFDATAGIGAAGAGVGTWPVAAALAIAPCYVVLVATLHARAAVEQRLWTLLALCFGLLYAAVVSLNYALQLTAALGPQTLPGWTLELRPDSAFWALEVTGYSYMGLSAAFLIPALRGNRVGQVVDWLFAINGLVTLAGLVAYLISHDPGNWLAITSLFVWGVAFPSATALIGWQLWLART